MATKTTKKSVAKKVAVKKAPVVEHECACGKDCPCGCHGKMHLVKHIIILAIVFALGMVCGKMMDCHKMHKPMHQNMHAVFTNGCLDMNSIQCPKMAEEIVAADVDADNCISVEEYRTWKKDHKPQMKKGMRGPRK